MSTSAAQRRKRGLNASGVYIHGERQRRIDLGGKSKAIIRLVWDPVDGLWRANNNWTVKVQGIDGSATGLVHGNSPGLKTERDCLSVQYTALRLTLENLGRRVNDIKRTKALVKKLDLWAGRHLT